MAFPNTSIKAILDWIARFLAGTEQATVLDAVTLKINGVAIEKTAAEINALSTNTTADKITTGTPVNAVAATGTLTLSGVVLDAEVIVIGDDTYEFAADAAQTVAAGNIPIDITALSTASTINLTVDTQVTAGDTMVIGTKTYTFVPDGTANADGEISVGTDLAAGKLAIVAAVNGTDGFNTASAVASAGAFAGDVSAITALVGGVAGDSIATTSSFTTGSNQFAAVALAGGVDTTAAQADGAIITASASGTEPVTLTQGAGETVTVTANVKGVLANSIATTTTIATAAFGDVNLTGGVDGTVGEIWQVRVDTGYMYVCTAANTIADANWERAAISSY